MRSLFLGAKLTATAVAAASGMRRPLARGYGLIPMVIEHSSRGERADDITYINSPDGHVPAGPFRSLFSNYGQINFFWLIRRLYVVLCVYTFLSMANLTCSSCCRNSISFLVTRWCWSLKFFVVIENGLVLKMKKEEMRNPLVLLFVGIGKNSVGKRNCDNLIKTCSCVLCVVSNSVRLWK